MFNNLKVRNKIFLIVGVGILSIIGLAAFTLRFVYQSDEDSMQMLESSIRTNYDNSIKEEVVNVISLLEAIHQKEQSGEYTSEEAKKIAADLVRELRYKEGGYFWIDNLQGDNIVLLGSNVEGTNRMNDTDVNGKEHIKALIANAQEPDGGFTDYDFPREGETEAAPKRAYTKVFEPYGWVIGTGNYTDDIDEVIAEERAVKNKQFMSLVILFVCIIVGILIATITLSIVVANNIVKALKNTKKILTQISHGDLTYEISDKALRRKDDFGELLIEMDHMQKEISSLIKKVQDESEIMQNIVGEIANNYKELNDHIEDVSATTEELAAGMEETAAASQEISETSQEIESAARNIAERSSEGSNQVVEIRGRANDTNQMAIHAIEVATAVKRDMGQRLSNALEQAKVVEEIHVLSEAIMSITGQTNLLALNASIEAARAGEAGKGFTVVADEIRNLAEQSKDSVLKIQEVTEVVVGAVKNLADSSKELLDYVSGEVTDDYDKLKEVAESYSQDSNDVDDMITEFSAISEELLASVNNVLHAIQEVARASNEGAQGTTDIAGKNTEISMQSNNIMALMEQTQESSKMLYKETQKFKVK